jgi:broad-specificity NMP kinase
MDRIIIALIGDHGVGKTVAADHLSENGFYKVDIMMKVEEFANHLFNKSEIEKAREEILAALRIKGASVSSSYWINLALADIAQDHDKIVIDGILESEIIPTISVIQICRPDVTSHIVPDIRTIDNDGDLESYLQKIDVLIQGT